MELSIIALGHVHTEAIEPLTSRFQRIEQLVTGIPPRTPLAETRAEINRVVDAASSDWILILREREVVDEPLAQEIAEGLRRADAWGFRLRVLPLYAGRPLHLGDRAGELRLLHRRHLLRRGEIAVQGTVIRLTRPLHARTFDSAAEHRAFLRERGVPHSAPRRLLLFLRNARTFDRNTLRYLWIEAGFDQDAT